MKTPFEPGRNFSRRAQSILWGIILFLMPRADGGGVAAGSPEESLRPEDEDMARRILIFADNFLSYFPSLLRRLFPLSLYVFEYLTFLILPSLKPFSRLAGEEKEKYYTIWARSRIPLLREMARGVRAVVMFAYYSQPDVMKDLGYDPYGFALERASSRMRFEEDESEAGEVRKQQ